MDSKSISILETNPFSLYMCVEQINQGGYRIFKHCQLTSEFYKILYPKPKKCR